MKNFTYIFLFLVFLFYACSDIPECIDCEFTCIENDETDVVTNQCLDNYECTYSIFPKSGVDLSLLEGVGEGEKTVFLLKNDTKGDLGIADDEYTRILVFELNPEQTSFSVEDEQIKDINMYYRDLCYCSEVDFDLIVEGCVQGEKQENGIWIIQGHIVIPDSFMIEEFKFYARFTE
ncbi:MAG: hypothetical protein P1U56_17010 [Saprospiraceae bacterium]|nr:hypothetical protein [Saprospiraceae bacterium]